MKPITTCNYDLVHIILYITGDLEEKDRAAFKKHLLTCQSCNSQYQALQKESLDFPDTYPFDKIEVDQTLFGKEETSNDTLKKYHVHKIKSGNTQQKDTADIRNTEKKENIIRVNFFASKAFYAIAASLIMMITGSFYFRSSNIMQSKGKPFITLYKKDKDNYITPGKNIFLYPGNSIQFTYTAANDSYFSLYSINEQGVVSKLYPSEGNDAVYLQKKSNTPIPLSFKLDDYIGKEFYIGMFSEKNYLTADMMDIIAQDFENTGSLENMNFKDSPEYTFSIIRTIKVQSIVDNFKRD